MIKYRNSRATFVAATTIFLSTMSLGHAGTAAQSSSSTSAQGQKISDGADLFNKTCTTCHGPSGIGAEGPNLHGIAFSVAQIESTVRTGFPGDMPSFAKRFNDAQIASIAEYVKSLKK